MQQGRGAAGAEPAGETLGGAQRALDARLASEHRAKLRSAAAAKAARRAAEKREEAQSDEHCQACMAMWSPTALRCVRRYCPHARLWDAEVPGRPALLLF